MALEVETRIFEENLKDWRETHPSEFVLIHGTEVFGFFGSLVEAFNRGTELFGLEPFLVRQVSPKDTVHISFYGRKLRSA